MDESFFQTAEWVDAEDTKRPPDQSEDFSSYKYSSPQMLQIKQVVFLPVDVVCRESSCDELHLVFNPGSTESVYKFDPKTLD